MGNVTIALEKPDEQRLRKLARERFGGKKGSMSRTVKVALENLASTMHNFLSSFTSRTFSSLSPLNPGGMMPCEA